ncbi:uncharacterized protein LOC135117476 [Helicoverpa armigera]|uniref:uncharacterized protein LOC135117476 n=1 Tax=Helicoverpa armigera TaxID=29058 RepID=UPI0030830880
MLHSPPGKTQKAANTPIEQTQSVPNIPHAITDPEYMNINVRHKRPRVDESLTDQLQEFKEEIKEMLSSWKSHQDQLITKVMAEQTTLVTKLISEMAELKLQNAQIQNTNAEIEKSVSTLSALYDDVKCQVKRLQEECNGYRKYTESLEKTLKDLQYKSRSSTIEIRNVPTRDKETISDLTKTVSAIGDTIGLPVSESSIRDIYRAPGNSNTNKPIVAEFTSVHMKTEFVARVRTFNNKNTNKENKLNSQLLGLSGQKQPVYIDEHLPNSTKKLYYLAREYAKQQGFKFCWTRNGNVFLRKQPGLQHILVKSETTLKDMQGQK